MSTPLEDYALIGDCETAALVSRGGSIDWLCWPRFDSGACFAALLGTPDHGRWLIEAPEATGIARRYRGRTLILETAITTAGGEVLVTDFMPLRGVNSDVVRMVQGVRGRVRMHMELVLRFDYGVSVPWVSRLADGTWSAVAGPDRVVLATPVELRGQDLRTFADFEVSAGEVVPFVLTHASSVAPVPTPVDAAAALAATDEFWSEWSSRLPHDGHWAEAVARSAITLKALTYAPTGGIVAAPTTSLPECLGGPRNWDYRYCWLRDATLTLLAMMALGYYDEAQAWRDWLLRAAAGSPAQAQIMYGVAGERRLVEYELPALPGYAGSLPVRVGNAAHRQLQLDVFGEVMDALHHARRERLAPEAEAWAFQRALLEHLETVWQQPDEGIWEVRSKPRHFTHSKVMAWVAFDRGIRVARGCGLEAPVERWEQARQAIHDEVCAKGYDTSLQSFVQSYGSTTLDASLLLIPTTGFLPPTDPRIATTVAAIEGRLVEGGFVRRYDLGADDGLPPGEGVFLACSFWLADAYTLLGRLDDARALFDRLLAIRNDVGLLAEEYDTRLGRLVGNFPQAFSHVSLIDTAYNLTKAEKPAEKRAG